MKFAKIPMIESLKKLIIFFLKKNKHKGILRQEVKFGKN